VGEIFRLVFAEVSTQEPEAKVPGSLVLVGGTANLPGIDAFGAASLGIDVKVRLPREVSGPADILYDPAYAASVGLLLWGTRHGGEEEWKTREIRQATFVEAMRGFFAGRK
jgi:cell division protein FtsA